LPERKVRTFSNDKELIQLRRKQIASEAVKVFLEKGYEKATMRDLGKACGLSAGSLYHYIGSKEDILHLIFVRTVLGDKPYRHIRTTLGDVSYAKVLSDCIALYFQNVDRVREDLLLFNREMRKFSREDRNVLLSSEVDILYFFEQLLREGMEAGEFQVSDPTLVAHNILMSGHDWALRKWFLKQHYTLEEYTEKQTRMILELVTTKTNQTTRGGQAESAAVVSRNIDAEA